jgi:hypothetical protein
MELPAAFRIKHLNRSSDVEMVRIAFGEEAEVVEEDEDTPNARKEFVPSARDAALVNSITAKDHSRRLKNKLRIVERVAEGNMYVAAVLASLVCVDQRFFCHHTAFPKPFAPHSQRLSATLEVIWSDLDDTNFVDCTNDLLFGLWFCFKHLGLLHVRSKRHSAFQRNESLGIYVFGLRSRRVLRVLGIMSDTRWLLGFKRHSLSPRTLESLALLQYAK